VAYTHKIRLWLYCGMAAKSEQLACSLQAVSSNDSSAPQKMTVIVGYLTREIPN
jgi:hypothetical protein